ncbi:amine oxidase [Hesseltinella vesiculosa]|uniref:Amine oxidase n=1 Tax=Hesseltinella vesiculosa TaxID=101127 RepID=A0A1X2G352_9FUNG|nr:amine oxidase [Hesseltinella vesiculosa]
MKTFGVIALATLSVGALAETIHTKVAILGGGVAGISAALNFTLNGMNDFVMVEARDVVGGRAQTAKLGNTTIEIGCNWVQGTGTNPINQLRLKYDLKTAVTSSSDLAYIDEHGKKVNATDRMNEFNDIRGKMQDMGLKRLAANQVDLSSRAALAINGWIPKTPMDNAIESFGYDLETGETAEVGSLEFSSLNGEASYVTDFGPNSGENLMVIDQRGFKYIFEQEAARVFKKGDKRLMLNTKVKSIAYNNKGVTITTDKDTIIADYAITTFSLGVLQHRDVEWVPELPDWKVEGLYGFHMATYTKVFLEFPTKFWDDVEMTLYANPNRSGLYSAWQNMNAPGYFPNKKDNYIFMVTNFQDNAYHVESLTDSQVQAEAMEILKKMYGNDIPEPVGIVVPRWTQDPLFRGSYSNWPIGELDQHHENMVAPLNNRVFFAGEAMSKRYYGFLQGAWFTGASAASNINQCIKKRCPTATYYPKIFNAKAKGVQVKRNVV